MKFIDTRSTLLALALSLTGATMAWSQNANSGEIKGTVTDSTGAVIPQASVSVLNVSTGVLTNATTNDSGIYDLPSVEPGNYKITFAKPGFRDFVRSGLTIAVGTVGVNAQMQLGTASQEIDVTADAPLVQTEDSGQHMDFTAKQVQDAPIVGGVWYNEITNVLPGVNGGGGQDASGQGIGVNGTQGYSGGFLMEGSIATQPRDANASDNYPPVDAIGEINVQTANFGSQYGNGVAEFNVLLKSGSNRFHGSAFEFIQNDAFNAHNYFSAPNLPLRWNEFGGSIGGPILKDKLFFYFTFQTNPAKTSFTSVTTVPTQGANGTTNMTLGCFPAIVPGSTTPTPLKNPTTGQPYPNNCINTALDPVALNIQKLFPAPNLPGYTNNYRTADTNPSTSKWYVGKVDYVPAKSHRLSVSYMDYPITLVNSVDAFCSLGFDCSNGSNYNEDGQITDVWTINSHTVNEARVGGVREKDAYIPPTLGKGYPSTLGIEPAYGNNSPGDIFPTLTIASGAGIGGVGINGGVSARLADGTLAESDVFTLIKGKHTIKLGGEFDKSYQNYTGWGDTSSGGFQFNGVATNVPYADFLLGDVQGWYVYQYAETGARSKSGAAFAQDDFKITQHLSLNLGMRWQYQGGWGEVGNRWGTFNPNIINTGQYAPKNTLGAVSYGGQDGRNTIQDSANEWAPRVGLSFAPAPKWAIRASYGITYVPWSIDPYTAAYGVGLNPQGSLGYGNSVAFQLKDGPPAKSVVYPSLSNLSNSQFNYQNVAYFPQHRPNEYYEESLLSVQHEIPAQILLDFTYVFTKGTHLGFTRDINQVPQGQLAGFAAGKYSSCYNDPSAYPLFCNVSAILFDGYSNYNALQFRAEKRVSHGLSFAFNYSFSKTMDTGTSSGNSASVDIWQNAFDVIANYGLSRLDTRHMINGYATYELPFGSGRMFGLNGVADQALGGWRVTGVYQIHSGIPFTPGTSYNGQDLSGSEASSCGCGYSWLPNVVGNPVLSHKGFNPHTDNWYDPNAFATPASGTFGNERRDFLIGPAWRDLDLSVGKTFSLPENVRLEVRADAFNSLNHPNFSQPGGGTGTGVTGGGQITSTAGSGRNMQLGGRFTF